MLETKKDISMRKCTKIIENFYLNLNQIVTFEVISDVQLIIITNADSQFSSGELLITLSEDPNELGKATEGLIYVELQELHRIKREISKYLGIKEPKLKQDEVVS